MPTSFDKVIDMALITVSDYKLKKLYEQDVEKFNVWCDGFLIAAIPDFSLCRQSLSYDEEKREFHNELTPMEIRILADFWVLEWFSRETQDATQIARTLNVSSAFTSHSAAQNLKEKSTYVDKLREKVEQKINDYLLMTMTDEEQAALSS